MRLVSMVAVLVSLWASGFINAPVLSQVEIESADAKLEDAREALKTEPGNSSARDLFITALREGIKAARVRGETETAFALVDEYLAYLNLRLSNNPTDLGERWARYSVSLMKYSLAFEGETSDVGVDTLRVAEKDIRFLVKEKPHSKRYKEELSQTLALVGWAMREEPRPDRPASNAAYAEAVELAESILKDDPESSRAAYALAYGKWWRATYNVRLDTSYEAYEASIPLYKEAALAFKNLEDLVDNNKGYGGNHAQVWYGLAETYHELGDDEEAFKAHRLSYQILKKTSEKFPADSALFRQSYRLGLSVSSSLKVGEEQLAWLEKMKAVLQEAEATGRLHPEDKGLLVEVDVQIELNKAMSEASSVEEQQTVINTFFTEQDE